MACFSSIIMPHMDSDFFSKITPVPVGPKEKNIVILLIILTAGVTRSGESLSNVYCLPCNILVACMTSLLLRLFKTD